MSEAMTQLGMVASDIDDAASVCQTTTSPPSSGSGWQDESVTGGQLTLDFIASHNQLYPGKQVSPGDLLPSNEPDHACKGTLPLKNGMLTCGCPIRADAPELFIHKDIAGFDTLSTEVLRREIVAWYRHSTIVGIKI